MIKFMSLEVLDLSHKILGKIKNAAYSFEISPLVPEIFKFEKCVKFTNANDQLEIGRASCRERV